MVVLGEQKGDEKILSSPMAFVLVGLNETFVLTVALVAFSLGSNRIIDAKI